MQAGYAYIHETETFGSTASPGFGQASLLDTIITVEDDSMVITVDHQVGDQRENIWMSLDNGRVGARVTIIDYAKMDGYGIFGFYALGNKELEDGPNRVMFNKVDDADGDFISLDMSTALVTLLPGIYHISAFSFVMLLGHATLLDQTNTYLQLQHTTLGHLVNGTVADATYSVPSELHYTLEVATDTTAVIYLEHIAVDATDMWSSVLVNQTDTGDIDTIFSHRWSGLSIYRFNS